LIYRHNIGIARDVYGEAFKEKVNGAANGTDVVAQVEFQRSANEEVTIARRNGFRCEKIADAVKGQPSGEQQPRSVGTLRPRWRELEDCVRWAALS
jgi:hypothetical protein